MTRITGMVTAIAITMNDTIIVVTGMTMITMMIVTTTIITDTVHPWTSAVGKQGVMPSTNASKSPSGAWWLSDGDEQCIHCGCMYVYELEFRCPECDGPACRHCKVIHAEGHVVCPSCVPIKHPTGRSS